MSLILLENYLDLINNTEINELNLDYEKFNYEDEYLFNIHLYFLLNNCYNIIITNKKRKRLNQKEFRKQLMQKFNNKCIISQNDCEYELKAAHIIPVADEESYDINNGLLLTSTLHDTYDKYLWSINPNTLNIEINKNQNVGQIKYYITNKINIIMNDELKKNLKYHYDKFIQIIN